MAVNWYGDALMDGLKRQAAQGLLAAAVHYANNLSLKVGIANPLTRGPRGGRQYLQSSKQGEYPRLRTGAGQKALAIGANGAVFDIKTGPAIDQVIAGGMSVKVGYREGDHHLLALEFAQRRKGLIDLLDEMKPQLAALATAAFKDGK